MTTLRHVVLKPENSHDVSQSRHVVAQQPQIKSKKTYKDRMENHDKHAVTSHHPVIALEHVGVQFGAQEVLRDLNLTIAKNQTAAIVGESGCGKTVLLKLLVGLLEPTAGRVFLDGRDIANLNEAELAHERLRVGLLFQQSALFDSLTVYDNVAFGLRAMKTVTEEEIAQACAGAVAAKWVCRTAWRRKCPPSCRAE